MSILAGLHHVTRYIYDKPIALGPQIVRLRPAPHGRTRIPSYSLKVKPAQHFVNWQQDPHGNWLARFVFPEKTTEFSVTVDFLADLEVVNPFDFFVEPFAETVAVRDAGRPRATTCRPISIRSRRGRCCRRLIDSISRENEKHRRFPGRSQPAHSIDRPLHRAPGTRRADAGRNACVRLRLVPRLGLAAGAVAAPLGLPARFVSGYLIQLKPDIKSLDGPERHRSRLHRSARLDRSLSAGRRLDRLRSDLRPVVRRRPYPGRGDAALPLRRADHRHGRAGGRRFRVRDEGRAHRRDAARHRAVLRRSLGCARRARRKGRRRSHRAATCASPWAASRPSCRSTIINPPNGTRRRSARRSASAPTI